MVMSKHPYCLLYTVSNAAILPCHGHRQHSAQDRASAGSAAGMSQDSLTVMRLMSWWSSALRCISVVSNDASMNISACSSIFSFFRC